jgi:hypothetical protein
VSRARIRPRVTAILDIVKGAHIRALFGQPSELHCPRFLAFMGVLVALRLRVGPHVHVAGHGTASSALALLHRNPTITCSATSDTGWPRELLSHLRFLAHGPLHGADASLALGDGLGPEGQRALVHQLAPGGHLVLRTHLPPPDVLRELAEWFSAVSVVRPATEIDSYKWCYVVGCRKREMNIYVPENDLLFIEFFKHTEERIQSLLRHEELLIAVDRDEDKCIPFPELVPLDDAIQSVVDANGL